MNSENIGPGVTSTPRRLFFSRVPKDFNPGSDSALSPTCFVASEDVCAEWSAQPFIDAFPDWPSFYKAGEDVADLTDHLLGAISREMNDRFGVSYGRSYWHTLLFPWLFRISEISYHRFCLIRRFVAAHAGERFVVDLADDVDDWRFTDLKDFMLRGIAHPAFAFWLDSRIIEALRPPGWTLRRTAFSCPTERRHREPPPPRLRVLRRLVRAVMGQMRFDNVWGVSPVARVLFSLLLSVLPARKPGAAAWVQVATSRKAPALPPEYRAILDSVIAKTRPGSLCHDFRRFENEARAKGYRPGRLLVHPVTWINERDLFHAAHAIEAGEKVVSVQYGCHYGTALVAPFFARFAYRFHAFLTWGWQAQESHSGHFIPAPSPYLSRYADRHRERNDCLVLVSTTLHAIMTRIHSGPQMAQIATYREWKTRFLRRLPQPLRSRLLYRPHHLGDWDFEDLGNIQRRFPEIRELGGSPLDLTNYLLGCRLLILDNPGTTLHIALAANVPTVGFWQKEAWQLCRQAQPLFDALVEAGVVFHSPEAAAAHIEAVESDVQRWWRSDTVQAARAAFCRHHARTRRFWWWDWAIMLARLSWAR